jgi:hypothetical protein
VWRPEELEFELVVEETDDPVVNVIITAGIIEIMGEAVLENEVALFD